MMFFLSESDGAVSGPHTPGAIGRKIHGGLATWESLICPHDAEDWVPAHVYSDIIIIDPDPVEAPAKRASPPAVKRATVKVGIHCERCGSDDVRKLRVIWESGTSTGTARTTGVGFVGTEDGFAPMVASGTTQISQTTALAARCAPPNAKAYAPEGMMALLIFGIFLGLVAIGYGGITGEWVAVLILSTLAAVVIMVAVKKSPKRADIAAGELAYRTALEAWERRYYCFRCGSTSESRS